MDCGLRDRQTLTKVGTARNCRMSIVDGTECGNVRGGGMNQRKIWRAWGRRSSDPKMLARLRKHRDYRDSQSQFGDPFQPDMSQ
jgi:hypothetical protein